MATVDVNNAPSGGFEHGGWYWDPSIGEAKQYNQSSGFGTGTTINNPEQVGFGNRVSDVVQQQSGFVAPGGGGQSSSSQPQFSDIGQVSDYLNSFQQQSFDSSVPSFGEISAGLKPTTEAPAALNRVETRQTMRTDAGVAELETDLTSLRDQQRAIENQKRERQQATEDEAVPMGVIEGRISEIEKQENKRLDQLNREVANVTDQLTIKYNVINTFMSDIGLDYQDAVARYDQEFSQNLQVYNAFLGTKSQALDEAEFSYKQTQDAKAAASTNLGIYINAVSKGNLDYNNLSADQRLMINKLELQSGMPVGFMSNLQMDPGANIVFTSTNEGITQVGMRQADGTIEVKKYGTRISSPTSKETENQLTSGVLTDLNSNKNSYGHIDSERWGNYKEYWISEGGDPDTFDKNFGKFVDPNNIEPYGVSREIVDPDYFR